MSIYVSRTAGRQSPRYRTEHIHRGRYLNHRVYEREDVPVVVEVDIERPVHERMRNARHARRQHLDHDRLVKIPATHNIVVDYFQSNRGMWDHDMLIQASQVEAERDAARRETELLDHVAGIRYNRDELERRVSAAHEELRRIRESIRRDRDPEQWTAEEDHGARGTSHHQQGAMDEGLPSVTILTHASDDDEPERCCERLLRFLEEESQVRQYHWDELRDWHDLLAQKVSVIQRAQQNAALSAQSRRAQDGQAVMSTTKLPRPSMIQGNIGRETRPRTPRRAQIPSTRPVQLGFMFLRKGTVIRTHHARGYIARKGITTTHDTCIIKHMQAFYKNRVANRGWAPLGRLRRLSLAKFVRMEYTRFDTYEDHHNKSIKAEKWKWICTAQCWLLNDIDESSYDRFEYALDFPLDGVKVWTKKLEDLVFDVPEGTEYIVWLYVFERIDYRSALWLIIAFVIVGMAGGAIYAALKGDVGAGLAISSFVIGLFVVLTGIWGAGEHLGVERPDMYSYSFDTVYGADDILDGAQTVAAQPAQRPVT